VGVPPREPWCFGAPKGALVTAWIRFRYRLLPYLYTLAHEATANGAPLVRPVWWPLPDTGPDDDPRAADGAPAEADDAFLLGDALLAAPVTSAGARQRIVHLPSGHWSSVWGDGVEGAPARCEAPLERMPLLARAGSVVPLDDSWMEPGGPCQLDGDVAVPGPAPTLRLDHAPGRLAFHCWVDAAGGAEGACVDDAGDGDGPTRRDVVRVTGATPGATARVTWERIGDFPPPATVRVVLHGLVAGRASADGVEVPVTGGLVVSGPFTELTMEGLSPAPGRPR